MRIVIIFITAVLLFKFQVVAQKKYKYNFDRYANEQGLSQGQVFDITEDRNGRIWIATYSGGVTIMDGTSEKYLDKNTGLPSYSTTSLYLDDKDNMWIGTIKGPCYHNGYTIKHLHISENIENLFVWDISADKNNQIWLATDEGIWYVKNDTAYPADQSLLQYPFYKISKQPDNGTLWFFSDITDIRILKNDKLQRVNLPIKKDVAIETILFSSKNHAFAATTQGIFELNFANNDTVVVNHYIADEHIICGTFDREGNLWVGTNESGVYIFGKNGKTKHIAAYQGIGHNRIYKIYLDRTQNIWIGTDGAGAYLFKGFRFSEIKIDELFQPSFIMGLHFDKNDNLWVTSEGQGVVKISERKSIYYTTENGLNSNFAKDVISDTKGRVYISTYNGITIIDGQNIKYLRSPNDIVTNVVEKVFIDHKDQLWIGTVGYGAQCVSTKKLYSTANGLVSDYIRDIFEDNQHKIYIGTDEGVNIIENEKVVDTINCVDGIRNHAIGDIIQDRFGNIWFASEGGVTWYNQNKLIFYPIEELCSSNIIYSIIEDQYGRLYIGTEKGIVLLIKDEFGMIHSTHQFSKNAGFFGIECNSNAVAINNMGHIHWGTVNGVTRHIPSKQWNSNMVAKPYIRSLELNDKSTHILNFADSITPWFNIPEKLKLPYRNNNITIHYGAPEFYYKDKILFRYKLEGLDEDWTKPTNNTQVSYSHLSPGLYTFKVQSIHKDIPNKPTGTCTYSFEIRTPLIHTWWFRVIMGIIIISFILFLWNYRIYALRKRKINLQKLVRERTLQLTNQKDQLEKANREIKRSTKLKEQFLANTSHEMRTPLNVIIGYSNLLLNAELNKQQHAFMENIRSAGEHLKVIINDLLDLSKIEADKVELSETTFNYRRVIINTFNIFKIEAENKGLKTIIDINHPTNLILGDQVRLTQIISNLLRNAIKFTKQGTISVFTKETPINHKQIMLEIVIKDTGIGIPENKISYIFKSFTQVTGELTRKYGGTGLGLSIVQKLVKLHNGTINVSSKQGVGTTFHIHIPYTISEKKEQSLIEDYQIPQTKSLENLRILVVDDNEINVSLANETLHRFNKTIQTDVAFNGKEAVLKHTENNYDLIIMDIQMPIMDGYEATKKIRALNNKKKNIPILGMTAHAMKDEKTKCLKLGMSDYLSKPFSPKELLLKIGKILNIKIEIKESNIAPSNQFKTLDIEKIKNIVGNSIEKERKYLKLLQTNAPNLIGKIESGIKTNNLKEIKVASHSLKTTFRYYGVEDLMNYCLEIENISSSNREDKHSKIPNLLDKVKLKWSIIADELEAYFKKNME